jgi:hypothetical protein
VGKVSHIFTRFKVTLHGWKLNVPEIRTETIGNTPYIQVPYQELSDLPFSSGMRRLADICKNLV